MPDLLADSVVYSLDLGALLAGTKYRGDFEKRFKALLNELRKRPHAVLFIDEIHTIIGAGAASGGVMDASNLLKPVLSSGEIRCIGSTTFQEFRGIFEKDRALARRFQKVDVTEPSVEDTYGILKGLKGRFEQHHHIEYSDEALRAAAELAARYINDRHMPDKAIDVIDEAGAYQRLQPEEKRVKRIEVAQVEDIVAKIARIPPKHVTTSDKELLRNLERDLKLTVFGQDDAIESLSTAIKLSRAGLKAPDKPVGSFLFAGPTGVGKTEVARQLAKGGRGTGALRHVRVHGAAYRVAADRCASGLRRLRPGRPAHRGDHQDPALRVAARRDREGSPGGLQPAAAGDGPRHPDRQQRAQGGLPQHHPDHDHQRRRRSGGARVDRLQPAGSHHRCDGSDQEELHPEFRNRLDTIIQFGRLSTETIKSVVDKFLTELQAQLEDKRVQLEVSDAARGWLAEKGYDVQMGARPMARLIQDKIKRPLAEEILFGELAEHGGLVHVDLKGDELAFEFEITAAEPA